MNIFTVEQIFEFLLYLRTDRWSQVSGGVAERLIAPVLKTGRPKGLVSSNLTPSAISIFDFRLPIGSK